jgi:hypothetical protein
VTIPDDPHERETLDELPAADEIAIPKGKSRMAVALALATVNRCLRDLEEAVIGLAATGEACARALDSIATEVR